MKWEKVLASIPKDTRLRHVAAPIRISCCVDLIDSRENIRKYLCAEKTRAEFTVPDAARCKLTFTSMTIFLRPVRFDKLASRCLAIGIHPPSCSVHCVVGSKKDFFIA